MKDRMCFLFPGNARPNSDSLDIEVACTRNHPHQIPLSYVSTQTIYRTCLLYMQFSAAYTCYRRWHRFYGYIMKAGNWASADCLVRSRERINSIKLAYNGSNTTHHPLLGSVENGEKPTANGLRINRSNVTKIHCINSGAVGHAWRFSWYPQPFKNKFFIFKFIRDRCVWRKRSGLVFERKPVWISTHRETWLIFRGFYNTFNRTLG